MHLHAQILNVIILFLNQKQNQIIYIILPLQHYILEIFPLVLKMFSDSVYG